MKKIRLVNKKERALLSDMLPYETPLTFSNKGFYDLICLCDIKTKGNSISWLSLNVGIDLFVSIIFDLDYQTVLTTIKNNGRKQSIAPNGLSTIPFVYKINHKVGEFRDLSIIHPRNQILASNFYDKYKDLIIHFCNKSDFSLRYPARVAKCVYWKDSNRMLDFIDDTVEVIEREQDNLKSFFVYKECSNIFKFFESSDYHRCEKAYNNMARLDISKCFDSIYTHSIAWATYGKDITKNILSKITLGSLNNSFGDSFDALIQDSNYKETNGIPIGPELSRVFAEIILQTIDVDLKNKLTELKIIYNRDYEIFRYVDDYFVFFNSKDTYNTITKQLQVALKAYKLHLNTSKEVIYNKPIITEITIAKNEISKLLESSINYELKEEEHPSAGDNVAQDRILLGNISINHSSLIVQFKSILKTSGASYSDVLNFTFSILEKKLKKIVRAHLKTTAKTTASSVIIDALKSIIEFSFFIYAVSPKVNTTIKLSRVLCTIINLLKTKRIELDYKHDLFKQIFDNIIIILNKNTCDDITQVETLHLITVLSQLGRDFRLPERTLANYLGLQDEQHGTYTNKHELNYFTLTTAVSYMRNLKRYNDLKCAIEDIILEKLSSKSGCIKKHTESTLIFFDFISCPYISEHTKDEILKHFSITEQSHKTALNNLTKLTKNFFITWEGFDLNQELDRKRSLDVY